MIEFRNVTMRFDGKQLLKGVDVRIDSPGMTALTGASGIGKTTLARMLLGLEKGYSGDISGIPQRCACVFQEDRLLKQLTVAENIRFVAPEVTRESISEGLERLGMAGEIDTPVTQLSGGMKRRVSILRALLSDAEMIVMDEPMKGLDESIARQTAEFCREKLAGRTLIFITHEAKEIEWMGIERVLKLSDASFNE